MRNFYFMLVCAAVVLSTVSCKKENPVQNVPEVTVGAYVLNNGKWKSNNSSLTYYNTDTKAATQNVFLSRNGKKLGDIAQDMLIYGGKMYITVANSGVLFVTDKQGTILKEIKSEDYKEPRYLTSYRGKVYATYYDGFLAQIDTATYAVKTVKVGLNPEGVKQANGKLYVANSGGANHPLYDKTVSVVDPAAMSVLKTLDVVINPNIVEVDNQGDVYVVSTGDYYMIPPALQRIDTKTDEVKAVELSVKDDKGNSVTLPPVWMSMGAGNKLYIISGQNDENYKMQGKVYEFDTMTEKIEREFVKDGTVVKDLYYINADPVNGDVYVGSSDYVSNGDMYVFGTDGKLKNKFETGLNPIKVTFLTNKK